MLFESRIASVLLPQPLPEPFDYLASDDMEIEPGAFVVAPLGPRQMIGVVWEVKAGPPDRPLKSLIARLETAPVMPEATRTFIERTARYICAPMGHVLAMAMRSREALEESPVERLYRASGVVPERLTPAREKVLAAAAGEALTAADLARAAGVSAAVVKGLVDAGALSAEDRDVDAPFPEPDPDLPAKDLTPDQVAAAEMLAAAVRERAYRPILLDGVTGSGKTEVYFEAIAAALKDDPTAQVLVLLPEIALTQAVMTRFEERFGCAPAEWHSAIGLKARRRTWREVAHGRARIVAGARSALFLPFRNLRLIIVDEEHDSSYKQEEGVIYQARDLAVMRAHIGGACIVLASATPSLETLANALHGRYERVRLTARPGAARLPEVLIADMKARPPERDRWIAPMLLEAMTETLAAGEQSLLYLNRRGYAPLVLCKACGEKLKAPDTDSWLTEHRYTGMLVCHLTGFTMKKPKVCPNCGVPGALAGVGPGVERLSEEARMHFPRARIEVFSSDTAQSAEALRDLVGRMERGDIDILIGTQIAAKGHNFPRLTLVGAVDADAGLKGGDMRAGERTFQLLSQVAGRAGRADRPGRAIIQTYAPDSPAVAMLAAGDRDGFMELEMANREQLGLPPFGRLGAVILSGSTSEQAEEWAHHFAAAQPDARGVEVWGPAPAPIAVLRGRHRRRFLAQSNRGVDLSAFLSAWKARVKTPPSVRVTLDVEPYSFM
ncbi:primosomal protein N' [bacterium]|nr:primosomal protein N' [bacterium]